MKERTKALNGLVLAGGLSSRMGRDKSLLEFHGMPQRDYAFQLLTSFCHEVFTAISSTATLSDFKNPLRDQFSFGGPVNGILSALELYPDVAWLSLPADMPLVDQSVIDLLIRNRDQSKLATCFRYKKVGNLEPLLAIWEPQCRKPLLDFCQKGVSSPHQFLNSVIVNQVEIEDEKLLTSVNSPTDLATLQHYLTNRSKK
jgi:molybdopterin-guanine dinucleotide biosynthesis protein A